MKYYIMSKATGNMIVTADSLEEARKLANSYDDFHFDDAIVMDESSNDVGEWFDFVYEIVYNDDSGCEKMDAEDARITLNEYRLGGMEIPAGLTAENFQIIWNEAIDDQRREYWECIHADDECEFKAEAREAAAYIPPALRGTDYDPQLPEDDQDESAAETVELSIEDRAAIETLIWAASEFVDKDDPDGNMFSHSINNAINLLKAKYLN